MIALENVPPYPGLFGVEVAFLREIEAQAAWLAACEYRGAWVLEMCSPGDLQPSANRLHSLRRQFQKFKASYL